MLQHPGTPHRCRHCGASPRLCLPWLFLHNRPGTHARVSTGHAARTAPTNNAPSVLEGGLHCCVGSSKRVALSLQPQLPTPVLRSEEPLPHVRHHRILAPLAAFHARQRALQRVAHAPRGPPLPGHSQHWRQPHRPARRHGRTPGHRAAPTRRPCAQQRPGPAARRPGTHRCFVAVRDTPVRARVVAADTHVVRATKEVRNLGAAAGEGARLRPWHHCEDLACCHQPLQQRVQRGWRVRGRHGRRHGGCRFAGEEAGVRQHGARAADGDIMELMICYNTRSELHHL